MREKNQNHVLVSLEKLLEDEDVVESRGERLHCFYECFPLRYFEKYDFTDSTLI